MDVSKPENIERNDTELNKQIEMAESRVRRFERSELPKPEVRDVSFIDKAGHPITLRSWENSNGVMVRAYDTSKVSVPDRPNPGQAGHAEANLDYFVNGEQRLRLNYIETNEAYRGTGIAKEMLSQVEGFAKNKGANEVYGVIENQGAQDFWKSQAGNGWNIDYTDGAYGHVYKKIH